MAVIVLTMNGRIRWPTLFHRVRENRAQATEADTMPESSQYNNAAMNQIAGACVKAFDFSNLHQK